MQFGTQNNNTKEQNTNTRGPQFMNRDGFYPSTFVMGYWNGLISLKFHPALPEKQQTESKIFDYDQELQTSLTMEKATILIEGIKNKVIPALEKGEETSVGVPIGSSSSLISVGVKNVKGEFTTYLAFFKGLNAETKKPDAFVFYEFRKGQRIDNYDPEQGTFEVNNETHSELALFMSLLESAREGLSNAYTHANRTVDRYFRDRLLGQVDAIAVNQGLPASGSNNRGNTQRRSSGADVFGGGGNTGRSGGSRSDNSSYDAPSQTIENLDDINQFMQ
ncbi:hypothetical protein D1872_37980 [compost metagenome]